MPELLATPAELRGELERRRTGRRIEDEAEELSQDLAGFVRAAWPEVEPAVEYSHNWHIDAIVEHLEAVSAGKVDKLQVWVPPGSMKSTLCSIMWPAWEWTRRPGIRYWTGSYSRDLSRTLTRKSRDLIMSPWYQARWGDLFRMKKANEGFFSNTRGGTRLATSPKGGSGTGQHGNRILIDDPLDPEDLESFQAPALEKANSWYDGTIATRSVGESAEVIIMQRLHENDLAAHALEYGGWTILCLPEIYEPAHPFAWRRDPRNEGDLLWPELFNEKKHESRLRMGAHKAAGRLQQRPAAREGELLKRALWRYYDPAALELANEGDVSRLPKFQMIVCSWDTTFKEKVTSDFVAGGCWGAFGADRYLMQTVHQRMSLSATKLAMKAMRAWALERWPDVPVYTLVENTANGPEIISQLQREITGVIPTKPSVSADKPPTKKTVRAEACEPDFEAGNVHVPGVGNKAMDDYDPARTPAWVQEQIEEAAGFPNAANDDLVDQLTQALNWLRSRGGGRGRVTSAAGARLPQPAGIPGRR